MHLTLILWIVALVALLIIDWRRRWSAVRIVLVVMALLQLEFSEPSLTNIRRAVTVLPRDQRVTSFDGTVPVQLDDYRSGIETTIRAIARGADAGFLDEAIAMSVLVWLAVSPIVPRRRAATATEPDKNLPIAAA